MANAIKEKKYVENYKGFVIGWVYSHCDPEDDPERHKTCRVWGSKDDFRSLAYAARSIYTCDTVGQAKAFIEGFLYCNKVVTEVLQTYE